MTIIEYLRRYLGDPEETLTYSPITPSSGVTSENAMTTYIRRYLADSI